MRSWRRGFTLVELIVVVTLMSSLLMVGGGIIVSQLSFVRTRTVTERIVDALQRASLLARSGALRPDQATLAGPYGVALIQDQYTSVTVAGVRQLLGGGHSLLFFQEGDPGGDIAATGSMPLIATLTAVQRGFLEDLHPEVVLTRQWNPLTPTVVPVRLPGTRIAFQSAQNLGWIDPANSDLANLRTETPVPGDTSNDCYTFDAVNVAFGYARIRIRSNGTVEQSGFCNLDQPVTARYGGPF